MRIIYLRSEINKDEKRTPLIPYHIKILIQNNFCVYVQMSEQRIYSDNEYEKEGAILTFLPWYHRTFKNALIIGLKEFDISKLNQHTHIYFSHSYKNQKKSYKILKSFYDSNSILYDFEYFTNYENKRIISFGHYAGFIGGALGILQFLNNISNLKPWKSKKELLDTIHFCTIQKSELNIGIIGAGGRCGLGVISLLQNFDLSYIHINRENIDSIKLISFDILYNCILLDELYDKVWFDENTKFEKKIIIVDISCDSGKKNNPIKIYDKETTFMKPVYKYNNLVDIIAINNLPSLLPKDSSDDFSEKCTQLLLEYKEDPNKYWERNKNVYESKSIR
jgi:saccharopine dehydrogenase (NAD+, L-lysine-forming)